MRVLFEGTGNVVQESANLFWDNTNNRLSVGTSTQAYTLAVGGKLRVTSGSYWVDSGATALQVDGTSSFSDNVTLLGTKAILFGTSATQIGGGASGPLTFRAGSGSTQLSLFSTGNFAINTTTDAGFKLDVNGTARVTQMTFPATIDKKIFLYQGVTDYAIGLAAGAIRLGTPAGNRVAMGNYTGATFTEICNVSPTGLNLLSGRVDLGADTSNVKLAIYTNTGVSMGLGVSASTFRFSAGGTTNNFVFFDDAAGNKLYSLISLTGAGYYGSGTVDASSQLQVDSTTRGFLPPRMTTTQKNAIATPATGLMVYDTTLNLISVYNGTIWISL